MTKEELEGKLLTLSTENEWLKRENAQLKAVIVKLQKKIRKLSK